MNPTQATAHTMHQAGISVVPVMTDGSKRPAGKWSQYQTGRATPTELDTWFTQPNTPGIGLITGTISGNLEMAEVEGRAAHHLPELTQLAYNSGLGELWDRLCTGWCEQSPSGGVHWFYRLTTTPPKNTKLARRPATPAELIANPREKLKVLAETRGEGGFVVTAPTGGTAHETGQPWLLLSGGPATVPTLTEDERDAFHGLLFTLNEEPPEPEQAATLDDDTQGSVFATNRPVTTGGSIFGDGGVTPGDDYEHATDWKNILEPHGWTLFYANGRTRYWCRPGKKNSISATTGNSQDRDRLYVFSSSTSLEQEVPYTKFGAYAALNHNGDHSAAASALRKEGHGKDSVIPINRPRKNQDNQWQQSQTSATDPATSANTAANTGPADAGLKSTDALAHPVAQPPGTSTAASATQETAPNPTSTSRAHSPSFPHSQTSGSDGQLATVTSIADRIQATTTIAHTDDGNAAALIRLHGQALRYNPDRGRWLTWNGHTWDWQPKGGGEARELAKDTIRRQPTETNEDRKHQTKSLSALSISNMLAQTQTDPNITIRLDELDARPWELNTPGGIIDLRTGNLTPPNPAHLHTRSTTTTPDFNADTTVWDRFLEDTFPDNPELIAYMQRLVGYSAVGEVRAHILPFAFGSGGNGKGVFLESIASVLGDYATSAGNGFLMASQFQQHSQEIARLAGARFVICSEVNEQDRFDEAKVKLLTGGDRLTARFMRQDDFTFKPTHHLWMAGNFKPAVESGGDGFWRRLRLVPFTHSVPAEKMVDGLQDLLATQHGPAVLAWIARGAAAYAAAGGLQEPDQVRAATQDYAHDVDTVGRFLADECHTGPGARDMTAKVSAIRTAYEKWCLDNGETPVRGRALSAQLQRHGVLTGRDAPKGPAGARMYGAIGLRADQEQLNDGDRGGY